MTEKFSSPVQVILLTAGIACWQMFFELHENADTYFLFNLGRYIFEHGFPHVDPFTIHENLQLVAQQWLSAIFFWEAYKNFGVDGLRLADMIFGAMLVLMYWRLCLYVSSGKKALSFGLSFLVALVVTPMIVPRPQIISTLLLLSEVFLLEKFTRTKNFKFLLPLPILSMLLINFHAAMWLMSLVVCLPFLFVKDFRHVKFLLAAMVGIFIGGLINPYGVEAMTYVFRSYGVELINNNVHEMFTPTAHNWTGKIFYFTEAFVIISLAKFKVPWRYIFLSGGIIFMAVMHERSMILFYFLATFPIAYAWKDFALKKFGGYQALPLIMFILLVLINTSIITTLLGDGLKISLPLKILFFVSTLFAVYNLLILKVEGRILHPTILPRKIFSLFATAVIVSGIFLTTLVKDKVQIDEPFTAAIKFLLQSERPENISLYVNQGIGGTAGHFRILYYIDSRSEVFITANNGRKNILAEYLNLMNGKLDYKDFFSRYNFTHIIVSSDELIYKPLSNDKNFRVIYESERVEDYEVTRYKIFVPKESHQ